MTQPRSSLAIALQDYKPPLGIRPGVALTVAAICLLAAVVVGAVHIVRLGQSGAAIDEGRRTVKTLHSYNAALEAWRQMATLPDSELQFMKERYEGAFARAFEASLVVLPPASRNLLRWYFLDGLTVAEIGEIVGRDKSNVSRQLARVRRALLEDTRARVTEELNVSPTEMQSLLRLVRSHLDVSIRRHL